MLESHSEAVLERAQEIFESEFRVHIDPASGVDDPSFASEWIRILQRAEDELGESR